MTKLIRKTQKRIHKMERGQVLIIVAIAIVGIVAIVGLALDVGVIFIANARLRRAVDAAVLAAALQIREGYDPNDLQRAATEFLRLNGVDDPTALIKFCDPAYPDYHDASLCTDPPRKLVKLHVTAVAHLAFLPVIGISTATVTAQAVSETASVDVVLVIDTSESMTWDSKDPVKIAAGADPDLLDPHICNDDTLAAAVVADPASLVDGMPGECHPFEEVKRAAYDFIHQLFLQYDRVAIVTFDKTAEVRLPFTSDQGDIEAAIRNLHVYEADGICPSGSPCRRYDASGVFQNFDCPLYNDDHSTVQYCTSTNVGGGLGRAGTLFNGPPVNEQSLWVVIILGDGAANAGACGSNTWEPAPSGQPQHFCRDASVSSRHLLSDIDNYDADDYARDMADYVGEGQQGALIFAIGLGSQVRFPDTGIADDPNAPATHDPIEDVDWVGERFFEYAVADHRGNGLYYFAPSGDELRKIFKSIAENIATRLSQ